MTQVTSVEPITHPEEKRGGFDLSIGKNIRLTGHGRLTPAALSPWALSQSGSYFLLLPWCVQRDAERREA
jgi:hypothetical protein